MPALKATLIIIIVLGHFFYYTDNPVFRLFHELGSSAVAMFFFVSGFGCIRSWQRKGHAYLEGFFKSRVLGILFPALIFLVMHSCLMHRFTMPPQYWFLFVIIFDYILFWCCYRWLAPSLRIPSLLAGSILFMVVTFFAGFDRCWWICGLSFPAGCLFADFEVKPAKTFSDKPACYIAWLSAAILLSVGAYLTGKPVIWTLCYAGIPWSLALLVSIIPYDNLKVPFLGFLGSISYEIYLSHITIFEVVQHSRFCSGTAWAFVLSALLLTIATSFVAHWLCSKIIRK